MIKDDFETFIALKEEQIETRFEEWEHKLETVYKSRKPQWWIVALVGLLLAVILFFTVFRKQPATNEDYKAKVQQLDSTIKYQQKTIDALNVYNESQDSLISNLNEKLKSNRPTETRIIHSYEKTPVDVRSYSKDSLRRAVTNSEY